MSAINLTAVRKQQGLTQEEVAQRVGVTQGAIAQFERGSISPSVVVALKLARLYGKTCEELFGEEDTA